MRKLIVLVAIIATAIAIVLLLLFDQSSPYQSIPVTTGKYLKEFSLPSGTRPNAVLSDAHGILWVATGTGELISVEPDSAKMRIYENHTTTRGNSRMVWTMARDDYGLIWLSELGKNYIQNFNPDDGKYDKITSEAGQLFK